MLMEANILAAVVSPLLLWAGAAAVSVPILIHLLNRRRFRRVRWAAVDFLLEANRQNRRRVRIEELILLALRCLAMLLIGLMLARVFVQPEALASLLGAKARTERIVVLDDSFSMGLRIRGEAAGALADTAGSRQGPADGKSREATVFGRSKSAVDRLVRWLRDESPDDSLTIVLTSRPDRPLRSEASIAGMDPTAFADELDALTPSSRGGNMPAAMAAVRQLLEGRRGHVNAAVYVVSDFQRVDWLRGDGDAAGAGDEAGRSSRVRGPAAALAGWAGRNQALRIVLVDTGVQAVDNLCVTAIEPQQAQAVAGVSARYLVRVANFGAADAQPSTLRVFVGDAAQPQVAVPAVPAGETVEAPVEVSFSGEGSESVSVELEPDALPVDNSRTLSVPVARALRVLVVNGEAAADPYQDEVFLLTVAMRPEGPQFSGNDVTVIDENELEAADLSTYHVVLLANVYRVTEEAAARLEQYAAAGGGVGFFLGDQVDPEIYNRILYRDGKGLLPAHLSEAMSAPSDKTGLGFGEVDGAHPLMRRFADAQVGFFQGVQAWRLFASEAAAGGAASAPAPATRPNGAPAAQPGGPARVLLRADTPEKQPLLVERPFGAGRALLMTTSIDKEWNNLADRPVYVVLVMELAQYLARPPKAGGEQLVGEPIRLPLDAGKFRPTATLKPPRYPDEPATRLDAQPDPDTGLPTLYWAETGEPGLYRFELAETSGSEMVEQAAVNVDPRESDLRRADRAALIESMAGLPVEHVAGGELVQQRDLQARRELWPTLLVALVSVLMLEQALALWFGSDRNWRSLLWGPRS